MVYVSESCFIVVTFQVIVGFIWCPLLLAFPENVELLSTVVIIYKLDLM